jgi:hypothetical protein
VSHPLLEKLRASKVEADSPLIEDWRRSGVRFVSSVDRLTARYEEAVHELFDCIAPVAGEPPILHEGGIYHGCWLESTGTINAELLSRFLPSVATATFSAFARHQRADGLLPYKITADGPAYNQIQLVTPLARSVWNHAHLNGLDGEWLNGMAEAMARYDAWIAANRDTLGTGAVEAFSAYDTGHDLSSRFWHIPDSPFGDVARYDSDNPLLPFIAPDLTANIACQRDYLGRMLGGDWADKAERSRQALFEQCFDAEHGFFYDRDRHGRFVRIQSDVLLRVLACEIGDSDFFRRALERYLLNTRKFFAKFPPTSIALDDPRFDPTFGHNSWNGPTNFLSLIRTPHAFEHHGHHVELTWFLQPTLSALIAADRFPQTLSPYTGDAGFTEKYSPSILCLLDFIERLSGILPRPDDTLWFTGLLPKPTTHRHETWETAYGRTVDGVVFELLNTEGASELHRDGQHFASFPTGLRLINDRTGTLIGAVGVSSRTIEGTIEYDGRQWDLTIGPNQRWSFEEGQWRLASDPGLVLPTHG